MSGLQRIISAGRTAYGAFWSSYRQEDFVAEQEYFWDDYEVRQARYWHNRRYADNTIYTAINMALSVFKSKEKLYQHIQGLRNPVARLVRVERDRSFGGLINYGTFEGGALGITDADTALLEAIRTIWQWSDMNRLKGSLVAMGSSMGDVAIKAVDDIERKKVRLEALDPRNVKCAKFDPVGNVKEIEICYIRENDETGKEYEYKEFIDKDWFRLFRDDEETAEYRNPYGFVPVRWVKHQDVSRPFGATSYHESRGKIDALNDLVSLLHTNIRQQAIPKFALEGQASLPKTSASPTTISVTADERDKAPILPIGESKLTAIVYNADIANGLQLALQQQQEIEADLPQLALQRMRMEIGNASGVAIENVYSDAVDIIEGIQANYGAEIKASTQMAISMASYRGYDDFRGYNLDSYEAGTLDFEIKPKSVFRNQVSKEKKIEYALQAADSPAMPIVFRELGYDEEDIQEVQNAKADESAIAIREMSKGFFGENSDMQQRRQRLQDEDSEDEMQEEYE